MRREAICFGVRIGLTPDRDMNASYFWMPFGNLGGFSSTKLFVEGIDGRNGDLEFLHCLVR